MIPLLKGVVVLFRFLSRGVNAFPPVGLDRSRHLTDKFRCCFIKMGVEVETTKPGDGTLI